MHWSIPAEEAREDAAVGLGGLDQPPGGLGALRCGQIDVQLHSGTRAVRKPDVGGAQQARGARTLMNIVSFRLFITYHLWR
jgi:hypothetical protein